MWDPAAIAANGPRPCVGVQNIHDGVSVTSIEFNSLKRNLLASSGREVIIQDIQSDVAQPLVFTPGEPNYH